METKTRKYKVSDLSMREHSTVRRTLFIDDQADFVAFDADFDTPFETTWNSAITAAQNVLPDEVILDQITQRTAEVEIEMDKCRKKFQHAKFFIEKAFPNNPTLWHEFGFDNYNRQRNSHTGMIEFMQVLHATASVPANAAALDAAGYDAAAIAEIETFGNDLGKANTAQERAKLQRSTTAQTRVETHNAVWDITVKVSRAAKLIYLNNPAKYNLYLLPASDENPAQLSISGTITDSATSAPIEDATVTIASLGIEVTSDSNGNYAIANLDDGSYTLEISASGYTPQTINDLVVDGSDDEPTNLNIQLVATL